MSDLCDVESVNESLQRVGGVGQVEVQSSLLQHLLVPIAMVLSMGRKATVVAPVLFY